MATAGGADLKSRVVLEVAPNCVLRPLTEEDVTEGYVEGLNDPVVSRYLVGSRQRRQTLESVRSYVRLNLGSDGDLLFGIFIDDALRGTVRLHDIDREEHAARIGILLFDRCYWGQGWATRAIDGVMCAATDMLGLYLFRAGMRAENLDSRRTFEGLGFVYEPERDWTDPAGDTHHFFLKDRSSICPAG